MIYSPPGGRLEAAYPAQGCALGLADSLRLVHVLSLLNRDVMSTITFRSTLNVSQVHT